MGLARLAIAVVVLAGCAATPKRDVPPVAVARPILVSGSWAPVYTRHCEGSITPPVLSPSGRVVTFCNAAFDVERGRLLRVVEDIGGLALVDDERAVVQDYTTGGIRFGASHAGGGQVEALALSPRRTLVATLEHTKNGPADGALVVREIPSLRVVRSTPIAHVPVSATVGFVAGDREAFFDRSNDALVVVDAKRGELVPLVSGIRAVGFDARGERVAVLDRDGGHARIVDVATRKTVAAAGVPATSGEAMALSNDGRTLVVGGFDGGVHVFEREGQSETLRLVQSFDAGTRDVRFSNDGKTIFVDSLSSLVALRRKADANTPPAQAPATPRYVPKVPPGFEVARKNDEGNFVVATGERGEPGLIGWYVEKTRGAVSVIVYAHEASEFAGVSDANAWGALVARRFQYSSAIGKPGYRVEATPTGRRVMLVTQVRDGCDPHDGYVGFIERDGFVYEIRVEVAPNTPRRRVEPLEHAFLDEPFGVSPNAATTSLGFKLPPVPFMPGPC